MNRAPVDVGRVVEMYKSGLSISEIAQTFGYAKTNIYAHLRRSGIDIANIRDSAPESEICAKYVGGVSENALAKMYGCDRNKIRRILSGNGVSRRGQSEAEKVKWSKMTPDQKSAQVAAANDAIRQKPPEFHRRSAHLQAIAKESSLSKACDMEWLFIGEFEKMGFTLTPQKAFGPYNIDIAINGTAIEIHGNSVNPHTHTYYRQRIMNLLKGGWHVIYIKTTGKIDAQGAADKVGRMIHLIESNPSSIRHYGMVRGSGQLMSSGCFDGDHFSVIDGTNAFFKAVT